MPEDYDFLQQAQSSQLEHPTEPAYINFVQRNPFLGVPGEQAFAIHQVLQVATEKAPYFLSQGLISYAQSPHGWYFSFFLELAERWDVGEVVKNEFKSSVNKMKRGLIFEQVFNTIFRRAHAFDIVSQNLKHIPQFREELRNPSHNFTVAETAILNVLTVTYPDALQKYVRKYGLNYCQKKIFPAIKKAIYGEPDLWDIDTNQVECFNTILRNRMSRLVRKSQCHPKCKYALEDALYLFQFHWNFMHQVQKKMTPVMLEKQSTKIWSWGNFLHAKLTFVD